MDGSSDTSPNTTIAILLGASEWPDASHFSGSKAFANSAADFRSYLLDPLKFGLPKENLLDLFDTADSPNIIDKKIRQFLDKRILEMKQLKNPARDLLVYFVGHGDFVGRNSSYYLATRSTSSENPMISGIPIESLASTTTDKARYLRRILILDCCYAAAAFTAFQSEGPAKLAINQTFDAFEKRAKIVGQGTTLFCSSGKNITSHISKDGNYTIFSKALLQVLSKGNANYRSKPFFSVREISDLTEEVINTEFDGQAPTPEVHSPDQVKGDVATIPFFPNIACSANTSLSNTDTISLDQLFQKISLFPRIPPRYPNYLDLKGLNEEVIKPSPKVVDIKPAPDYDSHVSKYGVMIGFDAMGTSYNPYVYLSPQETISSPNLTWSYKADANVTMPFVAYNSIFFGSINGKFYALDAKNGSLRWAFQASGSIVSPPIVANNTVFFGSFLGKVQVSVNQDQETTEVGQSVFYALDVENGSLRWSRQVRGRIELSPAAVNGLVFFCSFEGYPKGESILYALDLVKGSASWSFKSLGRTTSSPVIAESMVYFCSHEGGNIHAFDSKDGRIIWKGENIFAIGENITPALINNKLFISSGRGSGYRLIAADTQSNKRLWEFFLAYLGFSRPVVSHSQVFFKVFYPDDAGLSMFARGVGEFVGNLFKTKEEREKEKVQQKKLEEQHIFIGTYIALDATTGKQLWTYLPKKPFSSSGPQSDIGDGTEPALAHNNLYFGTAWGLYALESSTGKLRWSFPTKSKVIHTPTITYDYIFFVDAENTIHALHILTHDS